jgi:hypothetical protein
MEPLYIEVRVRVSHDQYFPYRETGEASTTFVVLKASASTIDIGALSDALLPLAILTLEKELTKAQTQKE